MDFVFPMHRALFKPICSLVIKSPNLNSRRNKEVLLLQTELLALEEVIIWVEHSGDIFCSIATADSLESLNKQGIYFNYKWDCIQKKFL